MKRIIKNINFMLVFIMTISFINMKYINVNADTKKPEIKVEGPEISPRAPMEGQEIEIKYTLIPQPFQHNIPKPKEIVLVLDKSGSMKDNNKMKNLRIAAKKFIDSLSEIDEKTGKPKVSDLSIGIVAYDKNGNITNDLTQVTTADKSLIKNIDTLKGKIDKINADGGTNTGDGLRKGAYILNKSNPNADKTIIFMGDGEPTYYSYIGDWICNCSRRICGSSKRCSDNKPCTKDGHNENNKCRPHQYYVELNNNNNNNNVGGSGSSDNNGYCLEYATTMGNIIKNKNYNVFSIGYGLGSENSSGNKKMKEIHKSMGGVIGGDKNTFFATDSGAIEEIFSQIADTLAKSYTFSDASLDVGLGDKFTAVYGFEVNGVKVDPIVYELKDNYWYKAEPVEVVFKVKANGDGDIPLFNDTYNNVLEYKDINGDIIKVDLPNPTITVKPYDVDDEKKLLVSTPEKIDCLIGDKLTYNVNVKHPGVDNIIYDNVKFDISTDLPEILELESGEKIKDFGRIVNGDEKNSYYILSLLNEEEVTVQNEASYELKGKYSYLVKENSVQKEISDEILTNVNVKRGQIKVKVIDNQGSIIEENVTVKLRGKNIDITSSTVEAGYITFETLPTENYEIILSSIPNGYEMPEINNAVVRLDYSNNDIEYIFKVDGEGVTSVDKPNITANLKSDKDVAVNLGEEVELIYGIDAKPFDYDKMSNESKDIVLLIDKTSDNNGQEFDKAMESIQEHIINDFVANNNVKLGIVSFDKNGNYETLELTNNIGLINNTINNIKTSGKNNGNITNALIEADTILNGGDSSNKNIIMVTFGDIVFNESKVVGLTSSGYNIFTTFISKDKKEAEDNIKSLHLYLKGTDNNYINNEGNNGTELKDGIMDRLKKRLYGDLVNRYIIKDLKLKINLGDDLEYIQIKSSNIIEISIPNVTYNLNEEEKKYYAEPINDINIKLKPEKIGTMKFGNEKIITYRNIYNEVVKKNIEVPNIVVNESVTNLYHGLYGGIKDNYINIIEDENGFEMVPGTKVTFGAKFLVGGNSTKFNLNIDNNLDDVLLKNIKVYKRVVNGSTVNLEQLTKENGNVVISTTDRGGKNFDISISNINGTNIPSSEKTEIVVIYTAKIKSDAKGQNYKNTIEFSKDNLKEVQVYTRDNNNGLPDLF